MNKPELLQRIRSRCIEDGGCLLWQGAMADGSCPSMKVDGKAINVRRAFYELTTRGAIPEGKHIGVLCECKRCLSHIGPTTTAEVSKRVAAKAGYTTATHGARIAAGKRKQSRFGDDVIQTIRAADPEETGRNLAERMGMDVSYVCKIRRGLMRKDYANPFAGLMA